ncbi:MAG: TonB-dependent receptor plug domain-containing protein, partial [Candidatus Binatia bacterium]
LLIDGRPTNDLFFGEFLAGRELPLEHIARIEIIRGPGSALYGTNAMAGVINVVTKDYADERGPGVIGEYGSFSTRRVDAFAGAGDPEVNGNFFFRYFGTGGANQIGRNDNQRQFFGFGRSSLGPLTLESDALDFRQEFPGFEGASTPEDRVHRNRYSIAGKLDPPLGEDLKLTARVYANLYQTRMLVASGPSRTGLLAGTPIPDRTTYDERRVGEEIALTTHPFPWLAITLGGEARQEHGGVGPLRCVSSTTGDIEIDRQGCDLDQDVYAAFLEDQVSLPFDVTLTAGFRYDSVSISGDRVNPRVHLLWKPGARTAVKLGYGEAFRAPSFFELRGAQQFGTDTFVLGNPNLDPEVVRTVEGEITHSFGRFLNTRVSSFFTRGTDMITQTASVDLIDLGICPPCGVQADSVLAGLCPIIGGLSPLPVTTKEYCFVNSSRVEVLGVESSAGGVLGDLPIPGEIAYGVNYTFQSSKNRSDIGGEPDLPLTPRHKANLLFNYRPTPELSIFWHTHWVGRQFADAAEQRSLSSYFNQNLNLKYRVSRELELGVGFYNLFGDDRSEALGVPREPRTILG